jgi:capsular polysaccharide biosynthesis protein
MEMNEVVHRIFGQHWRLIALFVALGIGVPALLHLGDTPSYTASARVVLDTQDPESRSESAAIVDTAKAIATSPAQVRDALQRAGVSGRDAIDVAEHHVSVQGLGSSGVFQLSVSDRDPRIATAVANALAAQVIRGRLAVTQGQVQGVLSGLGQKIDDLDARISYLDARIASLNERILRAASTETATALRSDREEAVQLSAALVQQRSTLETERNSVASTDALRPKPTVLSQAVPPTGADASRLLADMVLGALAGLILGVGLAGIMETFRPTLVGGDALARELRAPVLGALPRKPEEAASLAEAGDIAARIGLAAEATALRKVALLAGGPPVDLGPLAERLQAAFPLDSSAPAPEVTGTAPAVVSDWGGSVAGARLASPTTSLRGGKTHPDLRIQPFKLQNGSMNNGSRAGLILVLPTAIKKAELVEVGHLMTVTNMPLLGVITYVHPRWTHDLRRRWESGLAARLRNR